MFNLDWPLVLLMGHVIGLCGFSTMFARRGQFKVALPYVVYGIFLGVSAFNRLVTRRGELVWSDPNSAFLNHLLGSNEFLLGLYGVALASCAVKLYQSGTIKSVSGLCYNAGILGLAVRALVVRLIRLDYPDLPLNLVPNATVRLLSLDLTGFTLYALTLALFTVVAWERVLRERVLVIHHLYQTDRKVCSRNINRAVAGRQRHASRSPFDNR